MIQWMRKVYRVYWDFPMNYEIWGYGRNDMLAWYWLGYNFPNCPYKEGLPYIGVWYERGKR